MPDPLRQDTAASRMAFADRFPGLAEIRENVARWPKKPGMNERYTLREQRDLLGQLFRLAEENWRNP